MGNSKKYPKCLVSLIVPVHNENIETIVQHAQGMDKSVPFELITVKQGLERSEQRNAGIKSARGKYIMIVDADQYPSKYLISECVSLMEKGADAVYIPEKIITPGWFAYIRNWERGFYTGTPVDCVRFTKRRTAPMFDTELSGPEDADWDRKIKGPKATCERNFFYHYDKIGVIDYFKKKAYYASSMNKFQLKHPNDKVLDWKWRCFGVFFENGKWKRVLKRPDLFLCVMGIIFIRGIIYATQK